jgi:hypothetical protein
VIRCTVPGWFSDEYAASTRRSVFSTSTDSTQPTSAHSTTTDAAGRCIHPAGVISALAGGEMLNVRETVEDNMRRFEYRVWVGPGAVEGLILTFERPVA